MRSGFDGGRAVTTSNDLKSCAMFRQHEIMKYVLFSLSLSCSLSHSLSVLLAFGVSSTTQIIAAKIYTYFCLCALCCIRRNNNKWRMIEEKITRIMRAFAWQKANECVWNAPHDRRYDTLFNFYILFCHAIGSFFLWVPKRERERASVWIKC